MSDFALKVVLGCVIIVVLGWIDGLDDSIPKQILGMFLTLAGLIGLAWIVGSGALYLWRAL